MPLATLNDVGKPHPTDPSLIGVEIVSGVYGWDTKPTHTTNTFVSPGYTEVASVANRPTPSGGALAEGFRVTTTNSKLTWTVFGGEYRGEPDDYDTVWATESEMLSAGLQNAADFVLGVKGYPLDTQVIHDFKSGGFVARPAVAGNPQFEVDQWYYQPTVDVPAGTPFANTLFQAQGSSSGNPTFTDLTTLIGDNKIMVAVGGSEVSKIADTNTYLALDAATSATGLVFTRDIIAGERITYKVLRLT